MCTDLGTKTKVHAGFWQVPLTKVTPAVCKEQLQLEQLLG